MTFLIGAVAFLYSLVGHGGASGYLAVMSLAGAEPRAMKTGALILNLLVSGVAFGNYWRAGHLRPRLFLLFAASSIPAAFLGGRLDVSPRAYSLVLGAALVAAAGRMWLPDLEKAEPKSPDAGNALLLGAAMGFVSGVIGVGGGIFLSPVLLLAGWADAKQTAAVSAAFIWVNSAAGLAGHFSRWAGTGVEASWIAAALVASLAGSWLGARRLAPLALRRSLAVVLLMAGLKLLRAALA